MPMLRTSAVVLIAVVAALLVEDRLHRPSRDEDLAQRIDDLQRAQRELAELSRRPGGEEKARPASRATPRTLQEAAAVEPARAPDEGDEGAAPGDEADGREAEVAPPLTDEDMRTAIEDIFAADAQDPIWSAEAQRRAQRGLTRALPEGSTALSVRCGGSMCRIETQHHSMDDYRRFVERAFLDSTTSLWNGGMFSSVVDGSDGGEVTVVSYLARDGQPLPVVSRM
ncbi:MAG: hypothetical protein IT372_19660 [Polyangiaceae bacterium]|nr:hypothetical protein [Polyangiaceae bacterium]